MVWYGMQAYELFSHEADTGMVIPAASRLKNVEWDTQTTLFCWASQGVWPPEADGTEVTKTTKKRHLRLSNCVFFAVLHRNIPLLTMQRPSFLPQRDQKMMTFSATVVKFVFSTIYQSVPSSWIEICTVDAISFFRATINCGGTVVCLL